MSSYKALYRRYRPQNFSDVVDQEHVIKTLSNAVMLNHVSHAYLFNGPRGIGKTSIARIFAKAINCENKNGSEPCGECEICKSIMDGTNPDVIEIDAASRTRVEQMRETLEQVPFLPIMSKYKVYIIDEVHMLSTSSFNALLKTLEEPPQHVVFILCTTEVDKVIPTIRSRCQRFDFHLIQKDLIEERIKKIVDIENIKISSDAINLIADASEGGLRDALSLLDQVQSFAPDEVINAKDVLEVSGRLSSDSLINVISAINDNDSLKAISECDNLLKLGKEVEKIIQSLIVFYKDILMIKSTKKSIDKVGYDSKEFKELINVLNNQVIYTNIETLSTSLESIRRSSNKRLYLELALIKMCDTEKTVQISEPFKKETLENKKEEYNPSKVYEPVFNKQEPKEEIKEKEEVSIPKKEEVIENKKEEVKLEAKEVTVEEAIKQSTETKAKEEEIKPTEEKVTRIRAIYDISFIENILNKADRPFKEELIKKIEKAEASSRGTKDQKIAQLLDGGTIAASSKEAFIITYQEVGHCNLIMKDENLFGVIDYIKKYTELDMNFIAIPFDLWDKLSNEFVEIYRAHFKEGNKDFIKLTPIDYPGLKINVSDKTETKEDKFKGIEDLFGDIVTID